MKKQTLKLNLTDLTEITDEKEFPYRSFTHDAFQRKLPRNWIISDFDKNEKLVELTNIKTDDRNWFPLDHFFGKSLLSDHFHIVYEDNSYEGLIITGIKPIKIKRTNYIALVFTTDLPF